MKQFRSASQILFGFLPSQTVDLSGRVWKVKEWRNPIRQFIDPTALRRELIKVAAAWEREGTDGLYVQHLRQGREVAVYSLDRRNGINVDLFPQVWTCRRCSRVFFSIKEKCICGATQFGQLPFVGFHECGQLRAPFIRGCPEHKQVQIKLPGTAALSEIVFSCPICSRTLQKGLGFVACACGKGKLSFNVHRASPVYTPRSIVVVNPLSTEAAKRLNEGGGPDRALNWVLGGMSTKRYDELGMTRDTLLRDLVAKGISQSLAATLVAQAVAAGEIAESGPRVDLPDHRREQALAEAVTVAVAMDQSRTRIADLAAAADKDANAERRVIYSEEYPKWLRKAGLEGIELVERFPVLTGNFGYTRGASEPGESTLQPFRVGANYAVYADLNETEALYFRLDPQRVAKWLQAQGFALETWSDPTSARFSILKAIEVPMPGQEVPSPTVGSALLTLVHSYAHRMIRRAAVFSGIDRNALSELLVPNHLGFFVYAASRGDFVLGGLQAVFETELHHLLKDFCLSDHRCVLDPGCLRGGGACMACLHLGEPSCRYYNRFLARGGLFEKGGYLVEPPRQATSAPAAS